ncbi:hypothetical protein TrLO_g9625 [Triparma laevis f. longispina]|uniref:ABC1 atypical kinase-like domain-containing protein n=1 Tax=Triparma laevis f. longispina TaxID=1714387 RepID=A0A9W7FS42_9STRA|nr:hypothetical protein TrLO_g9625 [Triparma laevis f. longispina]
MISSIYVLFTTLCVCATAFQIPSTHHLYLSKSSRRQNNVFSPSKVHHAADSQLSASILPPDLPAFEQFTTTASDLQSTLTSTLSNLDATLTFTLTSIQSQFTHSLPLLTSSITSSPFIQSISEITVPTPSIFFRFLEDEALYGHHLPVIPVIALMAMTSTAYSIAFPIDYPTGQPYGPASIYSPPHAASYYSSKPFLVLRRCLQLAFSGSPLGFSLLVDKYITKKDEDGETKKLRAKSLLKFVEKNGCTYIKIGQAASVRSDIIDEAYASELSKLQDRVPPFPNQIAKQTLENEFGSLKSTFENFNVLDGPIASASIGQVYKATTKNGKTVAVKVQRPNVINQISLDLFIVRTFAPFYGKLTKSTTDLQSLADEWGRGFIAELNYNDEAENTMNFRKAMEEKGLTAVTSPKVVEELSSERILTTEFIEGTRLDRSDASDVTRLCAVALNAYLVMLLETGVLHCDPHPGNLLRTEDGRLVILDWGMTLEVDPGLQISLLEFVSHLTSEQYENIPSDFVKLDFLKAEKEEFVRASGLLEPLTYILKQAGQGGGGKKVRERIIGEFKEKYPGLEDEELKKAIQKEMKEYSEKAKAKTVVVGGISAKVSELQEANKDAFSIPEWFLYTSRAFLTLEGICLSADEDFSIISECFPYVAKRLLSDDSERAQSALKNMIYGASGTFDPKTVIDTVDGFASFQTATKSAGGAHSDDTSTLSSSTTPPVSTSVLKSGADLLFAENGSNALQDLTADIGSDALTALVKNFLTDLPLTPKESKEKFLKLTDGEEKASEILNLLNNKRGDGEDSNPSTGGLPTPPNLGEAQDLLNSLRDYAPGGQRIGRKLVAKLATKAKHNLEKGLEDGGGGNQVEKQVLSRLKGGFGVLATRLDEEEK